jgi:hypothetical protein
MNRGRGKVRVGGGSWRGRSEIMDGGRGLKGRAMELERRVRATGGGG